MADPPKPPAKQPAAFVSKGTYRPPHYFRKLEQQQKPKPEPEEVKGPTVAPKATTPPAVDLSKSSMDSSVSGPSWDDDVEEEMQRRKRAEEARKREDNIKRSAEKVLGPRPTDWDDDVEYEMQLRKQEKQAEAPAERDKNDNKSAEPVLGPRPTDWDEDVEYEAQLRKQAKPADGTARRRDNDKKTLSTVLSPRGETARRKPNGRVTLASMIIQRDKQWDDNIENRIESWKQARQYKEAVARRENEDRRDARVPILKEGVISLKEAKELAAREEWPMLEKPPSPSPVEQSGDSGTRRRRGQEKQPKPKQDRQIESQALMHEKIDGNPEKKLVEKAHSSVEQSAVPGKEQTLPESRQYRHCEHPALVNRRSDCNAEKKLVERTRSLVEQSTVPGMGRGQETRPEPKQQQPYAVKHVRFDDGPENAGRGRDRGRWQGTQLGLMPQLHAVRRERFNGNSEYSGHGRGHGRLWRVDNASTDREPRAHHQDPNRTRARTILRRPTATPRTPTPPPSTLFSDQYDRSPDRNKAKAKVRLNQPQPNSTQPGFGQTVTPGPVDTQGLFLGSVPMEKFLWLDGTEEESMGRMGRVGRRRQGGKLREREDEIKK